MSNLTEHIGKKIKLYRKAKGMTLNTLAASINKSPATMSKYENGSICIDIETLFDIAKVLNCNVERLIDYNEDKVDTQTQTSQYGFADNDILYMYSYDMKNSQLVRSVIHLHQRADSYSFDTSMYAHVKSYDDFYGCKFLYRGRFWPSDSISFFHMQNVTNSIEHLTLNLIMPLNSSGHMLGLLSSISAKYLLPTVAKVVVSREVLKISDWLVEQLTFAKEEIQNMRKDQVLILNRDG